MPDEESPCSLAGICVMIREINDKEEWAYAAHSDGKGLDSQPG